MKTKLTTKLTPEPALGEGEQGPRAGPRTCRGPAEHQRGAPHRTMWRPREAGPQCGEPGVRLAYFDFGAPAMCGPKRIVTCKRLILEVTQYGHSYFPFHLSNRIFDYCSNPVAQLDKWRRQDSAPPVSVRVRIRACVSFSFTVFLCFEFD